MYATRKSTTGTYTSNGKIELSNKRIEYVEDRRNYSGLVLLIGLLAIAGVVLLIASIA